MNFGNIFIFSIMISIFICTTALENNENGYSCYCSDHLDQTKKDKFCMLDDNTLRMIEVTQNRWGRADLSTGLRLKNYLKATNMLYVSVDEELVKKAQQYANDCPRSQDMDIKKLKNGFYLVQNFAIREFNVLPGNIDNFLVNRVFRFRRVLFEWKREPKIEIEEKELDGKSNRTNMMRSSTWKMGCGIGFSAKENEGKYREHYVCYFETGEVNYGKPLYKLGCKVCKDCPTNTYCDDGSFWLCIPSQGSIPKFSNVHQFHEINSCEEEELTNNEDLIWQCNNWKSQNCIINEMCDSSWDMEKYPGLKIRYCPFQNSIATFLFYKKIYLKKESCYSFKFILTKSTNVQVGIIAFPVGDINKLQSNVIRRVTATEGTIFLNVTFKDTNIQVGASTKSLDIDYYNYLIEIEDFKIIVGNCQNPKN